MTWTHSRVEAHQRGDCDAVTCPLCRNEAVEAGPATPSGGDREP